MEDLINLIGVEFIYIITCVFLILAILSIADNTKKTNRLLRLLLNEQNPERFHLVNPDKLKDNTTDKLI